ncbi:FKBP-type peptidyl-prolyl cis-trans isomerase [Erythrobacter sp. SD-21]|uniref:FKBP-type peptidyl-prolyl cis-trans isomerase n=1 Tax=Erythrobacter sp. SD-21 TaxID=161528 RepID=UPI000153FA48|nr:FKBP-type peptidyl-prolyl cis-trans isomerase [Erythrobacter sp. SD-21]EDL49686.1 FKBP-type peptidyl-prolyl cis-trans isomerase FkpA [Erythrobacter sp. SD-21]
MTKKSESRPALPREMRFMFAAVGAAIASVGIQAAMAQEERPDRSQDIAWMSAQQAYLAKLSPEDGWRSMEGGLRWRYVEYAGSQEKPRLNDRVTVHYAGTFIDGTTFDSSFDRGEPATFPLHRLVEAWQMAIPQMGVGDTIEIAAPADLAYGPKGKGPIPGGATLLFTVKLIAIPED